MFKSSKENKLQIGDTLICLDVGTEFLKVLIFRINNTSEIEVIEYLKSRQHVTAMKNGTITSIRRVTENIVQTISSLQNKTYKAAIMGIAGELVKGVIVEVNYERSYGNKPITKDELKSIIESAREEAYDEAKKLIFNQIGDISGETKNISLLNVSIVDAILDGFKVEDPIGITASSVNIKIYFTFAPVLYINYLKSIADEAVGVDLVGIVPQPFAVARRIAKSNDKDFSTIIIDIGGGTTDLALIHNGVPIATNMLAFGSRVFTKRIASDLKLTLQDAEDFKIRYSQDRLSEYRKQEVKNAIKKDTALWATQVAIGLEEFLSLVEGFPHTFHLCGGGALLPEIKEELIEYPWIKELPFNRSPKVNFIYPHELNGVNDPLNLLKSVEDVTPASIAGFTLDLFSLEW